MWVRTVLVNARNNRGSALIETLAMAPVVALVLGLGASVVYLVFAKVWLTRSAREAAVCLVSTERPTTCRHRLQLTLEAALPWGAIEIAEFRKTRRAAYVTIAAGFPVPAAERQERPYRLTSTSSVPIVYGSRPAY